MDNLEKQLNKLPKAHLSKKGDLKIRLRLYFFLGSEKLALIKRSMVAHKVSVSSAALIIFILSLIIIVPSYAYANENVIPGHLLYPIKRGLENIELNMSDSPEEKAETYVKLADRRLAEAKVMGELNENKVEPKVLANTINEAVEMDNKAKEEINLVKESKKASKVRSAVDKAQEQQVKKLVDIAQTVSIEAEEEVLDSVAMALEIMSISSTKIGEEYTGVRDSVEQINEDEDKQRKEEEKKDEKDNRSNLDKFIDKIKSFRKDKIKQIEDQKDKSNEKEEKDLGDNEKFESEEIPEPVKLEAQTGANEQAEEEKKEESQDIKDIIKELTTPILKESNVEKVKSQKATEEETKKDAKQSLNNLKQNIIDLKKDLSGNGFKTNDVEKLFKRLDKKFEDAQEAYDKKDFNKFNEIEQTTEALTNNGKHFLKPRDEDQEKEQDNKNNSKSNNSKWKRK